MHVDASSEEEATARFSAMTHEPDFAKKVIQDLTESSFGPNEVEIIEVLTNQQVIEISDQETERYATFGFSKYLKEIGEDE